ncbi:MAG: translation initiation factor IF-2 [Bacteroidales bacterium]|nr:translation initiation factor IF-2 [Bacteroidales bacterium]
MRLSKIAKDFNVGIQTLVEFLEKKGGDPTIEWKPMSQVPDHLYELLSKEFNKDKSVKQASERERLERMQTRDKIKEETRQINAVNQGIPQTRQKPAPKAEPATTPASVAKTPTEEQLMQAAMKIVGHIELDDQKKPAEKKAEPKPAEEKTEVKKPVEAPKAEEPKAEASAAKVEEKQTEEVKPKATEAKDETQKPAEKKAEPKAKEGKKATAPAEKKPNQSIWGERSKDRINDEPLPAEARNGEVFRLNQPEQPQINVLGTIDLDSLNQSTRPKKKTKEERKKEREQKAQGSSNGQTRTTSSEEGHGSRRQRGAQKVDINEVIKQGKARDAKGQERRDRKDQQNTDGRGRHQGKDKKKGNNAYKQEITEEDVQRQVKDTLARLTNKPDKKAVKYRKDKRNAAAAAAAEAQAEEAAESKVLKLTEYVTVNDLATMMNVPVTNVIMTCMQLGLMVSINQRLEAETINLVADEFGFETQYVSEEVEAELEQEADREEDLESRPPIITVMGHVDHGKTKLLDYIRKTNVIAGEAGGITQHIGAYNVTLKDGRHVTFLDTPGHEAFTAMRARGAKMTDIAIIIIAADDGVMPQTKEAINHAAAAGVPMVFAINKIDKPTANPNKVKEQLAGMNYLVEEWGGKYQSEDISARDGLNVDELLEKVLLEAELLDLKANPNKQASGSIIEATLDKGRGYVASVLVQNGTLHVGDVIIAGKHYGRVKALFNERGAKVQEAGPATPVQVLGLSGAPSAGDQFRVLDSEQEARDIAAKRDRLQREQALRTQTRLTLDEIGRRIAVGNFQELNLIVKGDVDGSVEALTDSLIKLSTEQIQVNVIHKAVGQISESDVVLAAASKAIIIGFQVRPSLAAKRLSDQDGVDIRTYSIIYDAIEEVKEAMEGMLKPIVKEEICGNAEVKSVFKISKVGAVAGCIVRDGKIHRTDKARVIRDGIVIFTGELAGLKRFKDDVKEVGTNFECGLSINGYDDIQEGDLIETYTEIEIKAKL